MANSNQPKIEELSLPVIYIDFSPKGFLSDLHKVLSEEPERRFLVLSGAEDRFTKAHYSQLLDHSARLPHMTVIAAHQGEVLPFPMILPAGMSNQIADYLSEAEGTVADWLEQSVYIECELAD